MFMYIFAGATAVRLLGKIGPVKRFLENTGKDNLNSGLGSTTKKLPIIDAVVEKYTAVSLTRMQEVSAKRFLTLTRTAVNTRVFELVVKKMIHDKWPTNRQLDNTINIL